MHRYLRTTATLLVVCLAINPITDDDVRRANHDSSGFLSKHTHCLRPFDSEALSLPAMAALQSRARHIVARFLRFHNDTGELLEGRRFVPVSERVRDLLLLELRWVRTVGMHGVVLMATTRPEGQPETPVRKLAALLDEIGDLRPMEFKSTEALVLAEIQKGERVVTRIARTLRLSIEGVRVAAFRIARRIEGEIARRDRDASGVRFEERPLADLRLKWPAERLLSDLGITTIGQLLEWSYEDLLRVRHVGVGRLRHINERLWEEGRRTLPGSEPIEQRPARDDSSASLLIPFAGAAFGDQPSIAIALLGFSLIVVSAVASRWSGRDRNGRHTTLLLADA
jgi:hypothetical protein